jgi:FAD:protein FMN transferase
MRKIRSLILIILLIVSCKQEIRVTKASGQVFGTTYSIKYYSESNLNFETQFDSLFYAINKSLSTYQINSIISKINRNEWTHFDNHFVKVFESSKTIYKETQGAFDPTIGVLVNAWGFGPEGKVVDIDSLKIDSLLLSVGFDKVELPKEKFRLPKNTFLDFNAIAKGYGVDVIAEFLESQHLENYLVEIGGEIRAKGENLKNQSSWKIGIENPNFEGEQSILKTIALQDESMATSGTYRKFKVDDNGNRYSHIIDAKTGYPSKTNLLSISVIAKDCMTADAYATAFKTMGIEKVKLFLKEHRELKAFLIFENEENELETMTLNGFPEN